MVAFIRFFRCAKTRVLAHCPKPRTIHGGLHIPCEGKLARVSQLPVRIKALQIFFAQQVWYDDMGTGFKLWFAFRRLFLRLAVGRLAPLPGIVADMQVHSYFLLVVNGIIAYECMKK